MGYKLWLYASNSDLLVGYGGSEDQFLGALLLEEEILDQIAAGVDITKIYSTNPVEYQYCLCTGGDLGDCFEGLPSMAIWVGLTSRNLLFCGCCSSQESCALQEEMAPRIGILCYTLEAC